MVHDTVHGMVHGMGYGMVLTHNKYHPHHGQLNAHHECPTVSHNRHSPHALLGSEDTVLTQGCTPFTSLLQDALPPRRSLQVRR